MLVQPGHDVVVGVGAVVAEDHVDLESLGDLMVNGAQKLQELAVAVPGKTLADHLAGGDRQRREQGGRPVALVVVGLLGRDPGAQRQERGGPVQRLDLGVCAPRGAVLPDGGERTPFLVCRSRLGKLRAARAGRRRFGWEQP